VALVLGLVVLGLLLGQWWFLMHLLRQNGRLLTRIEALEGLFEAGGAAPSSPNEVPTTQAPEGLPAGDEAPGFALTGLHGETLTLESLRAPAKPVMLIFTDPNCGPCNALLPEVGRWQEEHAQKLTLALLSRGAVEENRTKAQEHGLTNVLLQKDWEVSEAYAVRGTPSAVLIGPDGKVASPVAGGAEGIRDLLSHVRGERAQLPMQAQQPQGHPQAQGQPCPSCGKMHPNGHAAQPAERPGPKVGETAPEVRLADLEGNEVSLQEEFRGEETLVLFWNPGCSICWQKLPDLKEWEDKAPEGVPRLLVCYQLGLKRQTGRWRSPPRSSWTSNSLSGEPLELRARPLRCSWMLRARSLQTWPWEPRRFWSWPGPIGRREDLGRAGR
jgi:peroxiredoxin